ncbi:MAG: barstar family protein [Eubacteriales bacterium]|jgi:ribonuclease inhibitor|nr:barstar family protein [Eubacteriales bacterium]
MKHEKRLVFNAKRMTTRALAHAHLKQRLKLPDWYGSNLDALNDCLSEIGQPTRIIVRCMPHLEQALGEYGVRLIQVLQKAAAENKNLRLTLRIGFWK